MAGEGETTWPRWARAPTPEPEAAELRIPAEVVRRVGPTLSAAAPASMSDALALAVDATASVFDFGGAIGVGANPRGSVRRARFDAAESWDALLRATVGQDAEPGDAAEILVTADAPPPLSDDTVQLVLDDRGEAGYTLAINVGAAIRSAYVVAMAKAAIRVLEAIADEPDQPAKAVGTASSGCSDALAWQRFNARCQQAYSHGDTIDAAVAHWVQLEPDRVAVEDGDSSMTYGELWERSGRVAGYLHGSGIAGDVVATAIPRTETLIATLLGILRAGSPYLALDVNWPSQRIDEVIRDAAPAVVLTEDGLSGPVSGQVLAIADAETSQPSPPAVHGGSEPACIYYTSGSTGTPKGVIASHRSILRVVDGEWPGGWSTATVFLLSASTAWDVFGFELWGALINGGRCIVHRPQYVTPQTLRAGIAQGVNSVFLTSTLFNLTVEEDPAAFEGLEVLCVGGERVSPRHAVEVARRFPSVRLLNGYGPVETNFATFHEIVEADGLRRQGIPLGTPASRTTVMCARATSTGLVQPVPVEAPGEILIAGDGVCAGYVGGIDQWRFVSAPDADGVVQRWYRTGDTGVLLDDGSLAYVGRTDRQLKIRGIRVEPAEVEACLEAHWAVQRAVVAPLRTGDEGGRVRGLIAYCSVGDNSVADEALRDHVRQRLPHAMVPTAIATLASFPLLSNGKVDQSALPLPRELTDPASDELAHTDLGGPASAPDEHVDLVATMLADLLDVPAMAPHDNLIARSGDSLMAIRLSSRLHRAYGRRISPGRILELKTAWAIARALADAPREHYLDVSPVDDRSGTASPAQRAFWVLDQLSPADARHTVRIGFTVTGDFAPPLLEAAWRDVSMGHPALRTALVFHDGRVAQELVEPAVATRVPVNHDGDLEHALSALVDGEPTGVHIEVEPSARLRYAVVRDGIAGLATVHHSCFDGASERIMLEDLAAAARLQSEPQTQRWTTSVPSYGAYVRHRSESSQRQTLQRDLDYWAEQLADVRPIQWPDLPSDVPAQACPVLRFDVPAAVVSAPRVVETTTFVWLFTAFASAIHDATATPAFPVGIALTDRQDEAFQRTIGNFANVLPVVFRAEADQTPQALLERSQRAIHDAIRHGQAPFDAIVARVNPARNSSHPLLDVHINLNAEPVDCTVGSVRLRQVLVPPCEDPGDLAADLWRRPDGSLTGYIRHHPRRVSHMAANRVRDIFLSRLRAFHAHARVT